jgi:putative oxidoreductase
MPIPASWAPRLLSLLRIVVGLGFIEHGTSKFFGLPPFPMPLIRCSTPPARSNWSVAR